MEVKWSTSRPDRHLAREVPWVHIGQEARWTPRASVDGVENKKSLAPIEKSSCEINASDIRQGVILQLRKETSMLRTVRKGLGYEREAEICTEGDIYKTKT